MYQEIGEPYNPTTLAAAQGYPERQALDLSDTAWSVELTGYNPENFTHPIVKEGLAWVASDNSRAAIIDRCIQGYEVDFSSEGLPLFPFGRTGIAGKGLFGKLGPNFLGISVLYTDEMVLAIVRSDNGMMALPSGYVDDGEATIVAAAKRELQEEIAPNFVGEMMTQVGDLFEVPDPKTTDNAWLVAGVAAQKISENEKKRLKLIPQLGEVLSGEWVTFSKLMRNTFPAHRYALSLVLEAAGIRTEMNEK